MKIIINLSFALLLLPFMVSGQEVAFLSRPIPQYVQQNTADFTYDGFRHHNKHCGATRVGTAMMIGGGAFALLGGGIVLAHPGNSGLITGLAVGVGGLTVVFYGAIVYGCGMLHDYNLRKRLTVTGKRNEIGLAYNF
jgi:hypothetical protein